MARPSRVALALGSGGARGYAHIGVVAELDVQPASADVLRAEGTPMDDHRASGAYRVAMLGRSLEKLFAVIPEYKEAVSDQAAERMFERDKEDLRAMGIPLVTEDIGSFEDEQGYRIDQRDYALPPVELTADERAVVGLASRAWAHATMAGTAATAWRKVAADDEVGEDPFAGLEPRLGGAEPAFEPLKDAVLSGVAVRFDYARPGTGGSRPRHVEPWYLTAWHGRWYLVGHDLDREAARVFRLSRIASAGAKVGSRCAVAWSRLSSALPTIDISAGGRSPWLPEIRERSTSTRPASMSGPLPTASLTRWATSSRKAAAS